MNEISLERLEESVSELEEIIYNIRNAYEDVTDKLVFLKETMEMIKEENETELAIMESKKVRLKNVIENEQEEIYLENTENEEKIKLYSYRTETLDKIIEDLENL